MVSPWLCLTPGCNCVKDPVVVRHAAYVVYTNEKLSEAETAMKDLEPNKSDMEKQIKEDEEKGKGRTGVAERLIEKVNEMRTKLDKTRTKFDKGFSFNCFLRYKTGRKASKFVKDAKDVKEEITNFWKPMLVKPPPPGLGVEKHAKTQIFGTQIDSKLQEVCELIEADFVGIIGIWGMGGVGKTTLLEVINDKMIQLNAVEGAKDAFKLFRYLIFLEVKECSLENLQKKIATSLGLDNDGDLKANISKMLKSNSFLLLLDDIRKKIDLEALGIPFQGSGTNSSRLKQIVIFTTRNKNLCVNRNNIREIKVDCLNDEDSWNMFQSFVGQSILSIPGVKDLATEVANECRGLPLALKIIGTAVGTKSSPQEWSDALRSLRKYGESIIQHDIETEIFEKLKYSYDNLLNQTLRECFLSCSLWPEGWIIRKEDLIEYWIGQGLIKIEEFKDIQEAYNRGHSLIGVLMEACLLEPHQEFSVFPAVTLHDVLRDMALWIASNSGADKNKWIIENNVRSGGGDYLEVDKWKDAELVSLMLAQEELNVPPSCLRLSTVILNGHYVELTFGFFQAMLSLEYLDLSGAVIPKNPWDEVPLEIFDLVELQYLKLKFSHIHPIPKEVRQLQKLKYLYVNGGRLTQGSSEAVASLPMLRVLDVYPNGEVDLVQLKQLRGRGIKALSMNVTSVENIEQLKHFNTHRLCFTMNGKRDLALQNLGREMGQCLHELELHVCGGLEELIVEGSDCFPGYPLQSLQILKLNHIFELQDLRWEGVLPKHSFQNLKFLYIFRCIKLKNIKWVAQLPSLYDLYIRECINMEEIVSEELDENSCTFPRLKEFRLRNCSALRSIYSRTLAFPSLEILSISGCTNLTRLPLQPEAVNNPLKILADVQWWENLEWGEDKQVFEQVYMPWEDHHRRRAEFLANQRGKNACFVEPDKETPGGYRP